jgi:7SK snRNA methylphosphate capping enzyme
MKMDFPEKDNPSSHSPLLLADTTQLNKNQKKKLRQKRSRIFKSSAITAAAATTTVVLNKPIGQEQQREKRLKRDHYLSIPTDCGIPEAVTSAEPRQERPQLSLTSFDPHTSTIPLALPQQQQTGQLNDLQATMPEPVNRTDMTHVARFLVAHNYNPLSKSNGNDDAAAATDAAALPPQPLGLLEDSSPAGSIHIGGGRNNTNLLPTESAASAEEGNPQVNNQNCTTGAATTVVASGSFSRLQTAPVPAPPLDLVAPIAPNGTRIYLHGNYHRYYGYRLGQEFSEDPRIALLERPWFSGKRCMDVGCNEGLVTLGMATKFGSRSMIGVDIDEHLIKRACIHLREERSRAVVRAAEARQGGTPAADRRAARTAVSALAQTWFVHADFLEARAELGSIDCLTALSVTKWVHLHRGDLGLRAFFTRVHSLLAPGGLFILEPQPWKSYRAAADKMRRQGGAEVPIPADSFFRRVSELELRPDGFADLLESEFGFKLLRRLQPPEETAEGFDRPMFLFRKL